MHEVTPPEGAGRGIRFSCYRCALMQEGFRHACDSCGGTVLAVLDPLRRAPSPGGRSGLWRHAGVLPHGSPQELRTPYSDDVTLGEADTPLVPLRGHGTPHSVFIKLESLNPTLSFKDRAMALGVAWARALEVRGLVVASTGNAAVAASAYASAAGIPCKVIIGADSGAGQKVEACHRYGAEVQMVDGDYSAAYMQAAELEKEGWFNVSTTYRNPVLAEAYRPLAFELLEQLGTTPDIVVVPIGAGPLLRGIERGFADARDVKATYSSPALVGVQSAAVAPIARQWANRHGVPFPRFPGKNTSHTVAGAIADPLRGYEEHAQITIEAVEKSGGAVVAVNDEEIMQAKSVLDRRGFWVEPSSASGLAALSTPLLKERLGEDKPRTIVLMLTGHGSKVE